MEVELMVTKRDDDNRRRQGEYRAICLGKAGRQSFAIWEVLATFAPKYVQNTAKYDIDNIIIIS